jgi:hypothetical protein
MIYIPVFDGPGTEHPIDVVVPPLERPYLMAAECLSFRFKRCTPSLSSGLLYGNDQLESRNKSAYGYVTLPDD